MAIAAQASHVGEELTVDQQTVASTDQLLGALRQFERAPQAQREALAQRLTQLAAQRKARMLALLERNPKLAALRTLPAAVRDRLPEAAREQVEREVGVAGVISAMVADDFERGRSQKRLFVAGADGAPLDLRVAGASDRDLLGWVGKRASIAGAQLDRLLIVQDKRRLQLLAADGSTATTTTTAAAATPVQGTQTTLAILLDYNDKAVECTAADVSARLFGSSGNTMDQGYRQSSGGLVSFTGQAIGPFRMSSYSSTGACDPNGYAAAANAAAIAAGFDPSSYMRVSYVLPRNANCGWSGLGALGGSQPSPSWVQQCTTTGLFSHEIGHNLNFHHAATPGTEYGDASDPMGAAKLVQSNAPNRVMAGWLAGAQVQDVSADGSYVVNAIENGSASGARVLRLPKRDTNEFYYVSLRQPVGVDSNLWSIYQNTLSIHKSTGTLPAYTFLLANVAAGQSWSDAVNGITITHQGVSGSTATVGVGAGVATCARQAPAISVAPASQSAAPGTTLAYSVSVTNQNSAACTSSSFALAQALPTGFSGSLAAPSVTLAPGASATVGWSVASGSTSADAVYTLTASASESGATAVQAHGSYTVVSPAVQPPPPPPPTDTTPPTLAITSPANGSVLSGRMVTIAASASDASGVARVEFYVDDRLLTSDTSAPYTANWNLRKAGRGSHTIRVRAYDAAGNMAEQTIAVTL